MTDANSKTLERISAARTELEQRIQSEIELLDALKKVEIFFGSQNGSMTPKTAIKLLLTEPGTDRPVKRRKPVTKKEAPGTWNKRIVALLATGPKTAGEMRDKLRADGLTLNTRYGIYSALFRMQKQKQIVVKNHRYSLPGAKTAPVTRPAPARAPRPKGDTRWSVIIPELLSDGTARTSTEIFTGLEVTHGKLNRDRFNVMMPYLRHQGTIVRDAQQKYTNARQ